MDAESVRISINELRRALENPEAYRLAVVTDIDVYRNEEGYEGQNGAVRIYSWTGENCDALLAILNQITDNLEDSARTTQWCVNVPGNLLQLIDY